MERETLQHFNQLRSQVGYTVRDSDSPNICPMKGMRAVELASGTVSNFLATLSGRCFDLVLLPHLLEASPECVKQVQDDYELGQAHMCLVATQKLRHWQVLPWRLVGLGHWNVQRAREIAVEVVQLFDRTARVRELAHEFPHNQTANHKYTLG